MFSQLLRRGLIFLPIILLAGCKLVVLNPSGDIAHQEARLVIISTLLMLLIIVPVLVLVVIFARRYRKGNAAARYEPDWDHSTKLELVIWGAPLLIIIALGLLTWIGTHALDPYRPLVRIDAQNPLPENHKTLEVQVVAMDWKWLFIYPEQGIATVNELAAPVNVPIRFKITATSVMNAFYIPALAGQIYAMPSMQTQLNAVINKPGEFDGFSANYSGAGFSDMHFKFHALSDNDFAAWVKKVKDDGGALKRSDYLALEKPSIKDPVRYFGNIDGTLYHAILNRCVVEGKVCLDAQMATDKNVKEGAVKKEAAIPAVTASTIAAVVPAPAVVRQ